MSLIVNCPKTWYTGHVQEKRTKKKLIGVAVVTDGREENVIMTIKFCTRCGKKFAAIGREVICPSCKAAAQEETKRAAVMRAKKASWTGESVPVRISGRASTVIREYSKAHNLPFAEALDALLQSTSFFEKLGVEWSTIVPYKSHRRDKHTTESTAQEVKTAQDVTSKPQDAPQDAQDVPQEVTKAAQAAKVTSKNTTTKKTVKTTSKTAGKGGKKA